MKKIYLVFVLLTSLFNFGQTISISNSTTPEGSLMVFAITLSSTSAVDTVVEVTTTTGTAGTNDYTTTTTTVTIPAGSSSVTVFVSTTQDTTNEPTETFSLNGTVTSGNTTNTNPVGTGTITDDDSPPTVVISNTTVLEGNPAIFTITLSNPSSVDTVINVTTTTGTAGNQDYTMTTTTVTIPAGQTSVTVSVPTIDDIIDEPTENFTLNGTVISGNTVNVNPVGTGTITENDPSPTVVINSVFVQEGNPAVFTITLSNPSSVPTVIVVSTASGTAGTLDYTTEISVTVTIPAGQIQATVLVATVLDNIFEPTETFNLCGVVTSGNTSNTTTCGTGTIIDNIGIDAVNDPAMSTPAGGTTTSVTANDTLNGIPVVIGSNPGQVTLTPVTTPVGLTLNPDGTITAAPGTPSGTYTITYTICENGSIPVSCDTTIAIVVVTCNFPTPTVFITQPTCNIPTGTIAVTSPVGGLYLYSLNGGPYQASNIFTNLINGLYIISVNEVSSGCIASVSVVINSFFISIDASAIGTYVDFNGDGFVNVGDIINYQYTVTNNSNCVLSNVEIYNNPNGFLTITGGSIPSLGAGVTDNTTLTATHVITQAEINAGNVHLDNGIFGPNYGIDVIVDTPLNTNDGIKLNAFVDTNGNGVQDGTEQNYTQGTFTYQINGGVNHNVTSSTGVHYLYETNASSLYNLSYNLNQNTCASQYTIAIANYTNVTVTTGSGITTYNFAITTVPCPALSISVSAYGASPRPGFTYLNWITYQNTGNETIATGTVTFTNSPIVTLLSSTQAGAIVTPTGLTYNFTNLLPNEVRNILVTMQVPTIPTVALGQLVTNTVTVLPIDNSPGNNSSSLTQTIVGSWDPNDKTESHGGKILHSTFTTNDYLTYTIQFENTGTAEAINIRVNDVLDSKLDETSIRMIAASHSYVLDRVGNTLNWNFNGVNLPPSSPASTNIGHGYITFQIKPKPGYAIGDIIPNTANIYFDFNPAIVTNTCTTEFVATLSNDNFAFNNFTYYPNPVKNRMTISNDTIIDSIEIISVLGQKMILKNVNDLQTELDLSLLSNGIYFVKVSSNGNEKTVKVVKE